MPLLRVPAVVPHEVINFLATNTGALEGLTLAYSQRQELLERTQAFWSALMELASPGPYSAANLPKNCAPAPTRSAARTAARAQSTAYPPRVTRG